MALADLLGIGENNVRRYRAQIETCLAHYRILHETGVSSGVGCMGDDYMNRTRRGIELALALPDDHRFWNDTKTGREEMQKVKTWLDEGNVLYRFNTHLATD